MLLTILLLVALYLSIGTYILAIARSDDDFPKPSLVPTLKLLFLWPLIIPNTIHRIKVERAVGEIKSLSMLIMEERGYKELRLTLTGEDNPLPDGRYPSYKGELLCLTAEEYDEINGIKPADESTPAEPRNKDLPNPTTMVEQFFSHISKNSLNKVIDELHPLLSEKQKLDFFSMSVEERNKLIKELVKEDSLSSSDLKIHKSGSTMVIPVSMKKILESEDSSETKPDEKSNDNQAPR